MTPIKNIILDWSGTLVDDFPPVLEASNSIFRAYGKPIFTAAEFREKFFLPFQDFYKIYLPEVSMEQLDALYHSSFKLLQDNIPILPHSLEFLEYCKDCQIPVFLLSTIHADHFRVQGTRLGLTSYFKQAYTQAYDKRKTILQLIEEHSLNADETLFIGDMMHDIEAARHGGVKSCGVLTGYDSLEKLKTAEPDLLFRDLGQVKRFLQRHRDPRSEQPPLATVGALIFNRKGEVLMIRTYKWSDLWGIPGGKIKRGETCSDALRREVREETGLEIENIHYVTTQDCIDSKEFYKPAHFLLLNYTANAMSEDITLNDEADTWKWVAFEEALRMPINEPTRVLLEAVAKNRARASGGVRDRIMIEGLEVSLHLGVPDEERSQPQTILASIEMSVDSFVAAAATDDISKTVDYFVISRQIKQLAANKPRKLLETLAQEIAGYVLTHPKVWAVKIKLEKFILPDTRFVAVEISRYSSRA